jgi:hypothetical protein
MTSYTGCALLADALACVLLACDDDERRGFVGPQGPTVGGPCVNNLDCSSGSFCAEGGDFPEGTCTLPCDSHGDCPGATACIDRLDGVCLLECSRDSDCRGGYACKERNDLTDTGDSLVCIK